MPDGDPGAPDAAPFLETYETPAQGDDDRSNVND